MMKIDLCSQSMVIITFMGCGHQALLAGMHINGAA
jgi:hypothetical protein